MKRLLCWFGHHDWAYDPNARWRLFTMPCRRCGRTLGEHIGLSRFEVRRG